MNWKKIWKKHLSNNILEIHPILSPSRPGSIPQLVQFILVK